LDWPKDHTIRIKSLGKNKKDYGKRIHSVKLIGYGKVKFQQTDEALEVYLPEKPTNGIAPVMMIR
ncbi:MAG: alpha-L-fucosidase, partial [Prevotella sp.]|nr:alpha-L-fucosidase [Prevotella sp.]